MEQIGDLRSAINFSLDPMQSMGNSGASSNTTARDAKDRLRLPLPSSDGNAGKAFINSYYASMGTTTWSSSTVDKTECNAGSGGSAGLFWNALSYGIRDCTDGSSNTVAFSEALVRDANATGHARAPVHATGVNQSNGYSGVRCQQATARRCSTRPSSSATSTSRRPRSEPGLSVNKGWFWAWGAEAQSLFNTIVPPNSITSTWGQCRFGCRTCGTYSADHSNITNATSNHPGGCNVLMGDGSVRFVKSSIAINIWWAIGTKAGGEVVSADSY